MLTKQEELKVLAMFVPNADLISDAARAACEFVGAGWTWFGTHCTATPVRVAGKNPSSSGSPSTTGSRGDTFEIEWTCISS